jgi:hypothetical protein
VFLVATLASDLYVTAAMAVSPFRNGNAVFRSVRVPPEGIFKLVTLLACCTALATAAPASADSTPAGDFSFQFSSTQPGTPTGLEFRQLYKNPNDPNAKPSPVRRFLFGAPEGSVFDGAAVPACNATDQQFQQMGKAACPAESVVGAGFITVMTGTPGEQPFALDATVFNGGDGIIELFTEQNTGLFLAIERPSFRGAATFEDTDVAPTPGGPPDFQSAAREAYLAFPLSRGPDGRSFITTPSECPASGLWTARFEWTNADGNSYSNTDDMTCVPAVAAHCPLDQHGTAADDSPQTLPGTDAGDSISGGGGDDRLRGGRGDDCLYGGGGADQLSGNRDGDELRGARGHDRSRGGPGADTVYGGSGPDRIFGGSGDDWLSGGEGNDVINAVDGERDRVLCNGGNRDRVRADAIDQVGRGCDRVGIKRG